MADVKETKHDRFLRLIQARVPKALDAIRLIGQLGSSNYESSADEVEEIQAVLQGSLDASMKELGAKIVKGPTPPDYGGAEWKLVDDALTCLNEGNYDLAKQRLIQAFAS